MLKRFGSFLTVVIFIIFLPISLSSALRDRAASIVSPLASFFVQQNTGLVNFFNNIEQIPHLRGDKQNLQQEIIILQQQLADKENIVRENESLRKELGVTGTTRAIPKAFARIILQGSDPLDRTFVVNVGSDQGVRKGQPAVYQGFLLGQVITVRSNTAVVRSILSKESRVQAWVAENREKGLLVGDGNAVYLSELSQGVEINNNAVVETNGLGGSLPQGIVIGQIGPVQSKKSDPSQKYFISLSQDPSTVESLFILLTDSQ